jgi:hypothetical protein
MKNRSQVNQKYTRYFLRVSFILFVSFQLSCSKIDDNHDNSEYNFAIYLLEDPNIKINDILTFELVNQDSQALAKTELQKNPWLTDNDIEIYDFSSHLLYLKKNKYDFLPKPVELDVPSSWYDKPFVVVAGGIKRYVGCFRGFYPGDPWPIPVIDCTENYLFPDDLLLISWQWFNQNETDNRNDSVVMEKLSNASILHSGLELKLKNIRLPENSDTATVEYTFTLINNDSDDLYILDPDKMESGLFHFYNIGPQFVKSDEVGVRTALFHKPVIPQPHDTWNLDWFTKLNSGDSISRTVSLRGYPHFPSGNYYCEVTYQCIKKITPNQRILSDGRYWIGPTKSNLIGILLF